MRLPDIPQRFWSESQYRTAAVAWGDDSRVHIADPDSGMTLHGLEASPRTTLIVGAERDAEDLCPICERMVTNWMASS